MRCSTAIIRTLMTHPNYRVYDWVMEEAINMAKPHFKNHWDVSFLMNFPVKDAYEIADPETPRIIKIQRSNGLWKIKDCRRGIATKLVQQAIADARERRYVCIEASAHDRGIAPLLEHCGFSRIPLARAGNEMFAERAFYRLNIEGT